MIDVDPALFDSLLGQPVHAAIRIDDGQPTNAVRVVREVQACTEADFQNITFGLRDKLLAMFGHRLGVQGQLAKAWEDELRIEAHSYS